MGFYWNLFLNWYQNEVNNLAENTVDRQVGLFYHFFSTV